MGLLKAGMLVVAQNSSNHVDTPAWICSHGKCGKTALRAFSSSGFEKASSLRLVFLSSSEDPGPWDPSDPVAVEPSLCPSEIQELAELEPFEVEAALVSKVATRAEAANNLFNTCNLSSLSGHCLGKRLDAIFDCGRVLQEL